MRAWMLIFGTLMLVGVNVAVPDARAATDADAKLRVLRVLFESGCLDVAGKIAEAPDPAPLYAAVLGLAEHGPSAVRGFFGCTGTATARGPKPSNTAVAGLHPLVVTRRMEATAPATTDEVDVRPPTGAEHGRREALLSPDTGSHAEVTEVAVDNGADKGNGLVVKTAKEKNEEDKFAGFNFGVSMGLTIDTGQHDRIDSARLVPTTVKNRKGEEKEVNIVRVEKESNVIPRFMLESHYFFLPPFRLLWQVDEGKWGLGPYVAVQPGGDNIIDAVGAGLMVGLRRPAGGLFREGDSFNLGLGAVVDPNVKILGDGFDPNKPAPKGETQVRLKETDQVGLLATFSYAF